MRFIKAVCKFYTRYHFYFQQLYSIEMRVALNNIQYCNITLTRISVCNNAVRRINLIVLKSISSYISIPTSICKSILISISIFNSINNTIAHSPSLMNINILTISCIIRNPPCSSSAIRVPQQGVAAAVAPQTSDPGVIRSEHSGVIIYKYIFFVFCTCGRFASTL